MQDMQVATHGVDPWREPSVLHYCKYPLRRISNIIKLNDALLPVQLLWISTKCTADQDWFLCPGRQEKETARLSGWVSHGIMALRMFLLGL